MPVVKGKHYPYTKKGKAAAKKAAKKTNSILVLNPRLPVVKKDGSNTFHLSGIKLKENNKPRIFFTTATIRLFERIGEFISVNPDEDVYRLNIERTFLISEIKGIKNNGFNKIATSNKIKNNYRTYDYYKARKSPVYLDHLKVANKDDYRTESDDSRKD